MSRVDGISTELYGRLTFFPPKVRHAVILMYSLPVSLLFMALANVGDQFQNSDAIGLGSPWTEESPLLRRETARPVAVTELGNVTKDHQRTRHARHPLRQPR